MRPDGRSIGVILRILFGLSGIAFLVLAFIRTLERVDVRIVPPAGHLAVAGALLMGTLVCAAMAWLALLGDRGAKRILVRGFFLGQLGKYIPGMVWQPLGQIGWAVRAGVGLQAASAAFPVHALTQVAAAGCIGALYAGAGGEHPLIRLGVLAGLLPVLLLHRSWMSGVLRLVGRVVPRLAAPEEVLPPQRRILAAFGWSLLSLGTAAGAFSVTWSGLGAEGGPLRTAAAFSLGWAAGFLAIPFPAGIGPREAVLIALLGAPAALVIAASLALRLLMMGAEALLLGATSLRRR